MQAEAGRAQAGQDFRGYVDNLLFRDCARCFAFAERLEDRMPHLTRTLSPNSFRKLHLSFHPIGRSSQAVRRIDPPGAVLGV